MVEHRVLTALDQQWYVALLGNVNDGVVAVDSSGRVLFLNTVAETLTGFNNESAVDQDLTQVLKAYLETTREPIENVAAEVLRTGQTVEISSQTILVSQDGNEALIEGTATPVLNKESRILGVLIVFRNVGERRQTQLLNSQLAAIVESSDDIIASKDLDGIITSWNRGAELTLGYSAAEIVGRHVAMLVPQEALEDVENILERICRGDKVDHYETKRRRKDGTIIDVSLTVSPIKDANGRIVGASKIGRDITKEKQLEFERREADRRKDEFLAMLAHELRNPLSAISNAAQLFGRLESEAELEWAKDVVQRHVGNLSRLIDDLLDVSRISRGKVVLRKEQLSISQVVHSAVEAVTPLLEERRHEFSVSLLNGGLRTEADPLRLEQILVNLLNNAAKYTDYGGSISLTVKRVDDRIIIQVADNGIGIPLELQPRIFELFAQGDRTMARSEGGLGIGLTLVQKLTEMHGGTVSVFSEGPGFGSEFTISLPAVGEAIAAAPKALEQLPSVALKKSKILIVDDNIDNAESLAELLRVLGHEVSTAYDGSQSLTIARALQPDIVILDIGLPGMDGYQVIRLLREEPFGRSATFIAVSGYGQPEDVRRSTDAGFDHHLTKPVDYETLQMLFSTAAI